MQSPPRTPSGAVKRIMQELKELTEHSSPDYAAHPLADNLFEWHFTVMGPPDTEFHGGRYHGRILLPSDYPFKPPDIMLLTPSGRFEIGKKICLSISGFHPEHWQPSWSIRTVLVALVAFMPSDPQGAIGSLDYSKPERRKMAAESVSWSCETCGGVPELSVAAANETVVSPTTVATNPPDSNQETSLGRLSPEQSPSLQASATAESAIANAGTSEISADIAPAAQRDQDDVWWTSFSLVLVTGILAILIKKAIYT